ncbi:unnamed protein product [Closterium sp. NIES-53]
MHPMTCTRPDLAYPLSLLARYVAPGRHQKVHSDAAKRVLRYLCSTSGMGLVLGGRGSVVLTGHSDASWADDRRDYELHSLDFSTTFLQGSLHEIYPPGFTRSFPAGTQWSLWRPVYGLHQAPQEWHDTLRTTLVALGFAPSSTDPSLFLRIDTTLSPLYVLMYVLQRFGFQFSSPQPTPPSTGHSLSAPPSDESVEPSGPYQELAGCLITSGMGLVLGGRGSVVLRGHSDASWADDRATLRSREAEIYAGAMATQELHWLTSLLTDLGERPCSPPVRYVDNKAMLALCHEQRLEHRTKHIALRYFRVQELQQRGQLRLSFVASRANTADVFTKVLRSDDH